MLKALFAFSRIGFVVLVAGFAVWGIWRFVRRRLYGDRAIEIARRERSLRGRERAAELEKRDLELRAHENALERARSFLSERRQELEDAEFEALLRLLDAAHPGLHTERAELTRSEMIRARLRAKAEGKSPSESDEKESSGPTNPRVEREGEGA